MGQDEGHVTQSELMSTFVRIHLGPCRKEHGSFSLRSLAGEELPENSKKPTQKLFNSLDHPL